VAHRPDLVQRHREQREASYRRQLDVARELVEDRQWSEVSIGLVAQRAGLTRTAFYKHFADRRALLMALFGEVSDELSTAPSAWLEAGDPPAGLREALADLVAVYVRHGRLLRAIAEESTQDAELGDAYSRFGAEAAARTAEQIERDVAAGRSSVTDPAETATALVWMNERYLNERFGHHPLGDADRCAAALTEVWVRTIYG
jgi:AcrR family transcriptional regulator